MPEELLYLKPNLVCEALFERWYAWSHLISPATAAMNITGRHLKIMNSYIQAPHIHEAAVKNPAMLGGPFIDIPKERVREVAQLRDYTRTHQQLLIRLSEAIKELDGMLKKHPKGYSLEGLYEKVPDMLRGYVELVYDLNHNPSFRFIEPLLYHSPFYDESYQSIALWLTDNDERPFVLSTPRIDAGNAIHRAIPFRSETIDTLARMKHVPGSYQRIRDLLGISQEEEPLFRSFFTEAPPKPYDRYRGDKIRMRYFGHACILIETREVSILVDPLISYYGYPQEVDRFSDMDLPETIDYVLITHNHQDHILLETLLPLRHKIRNIVVPRSSSGALQDPSLKLMFQNIGFRNIIEVGELEQVVFNDCVITGIPFLGEHSDLNIQAKICHHIRIGEFKVMFVADSCNIEDRVYQNVQRIVGNVDVIFLGMECEGAPLSWLYGPLLTEDLARDRDFSRKLNGSDFGKGLSLVNHFNPGEVYVYAMGLEPWLEFISSKRYTDESHPIVESNRLLNHLQQRGITAERLFGEKELLYKKMNLETVPADDAHLVAG